MTTCIAENTGFDYDVLEEIISNCLGNNDDGNDLEYNMFLTCIADNTGVTYDVLEEIFPNCFANYYDDDPNNDTGYDDNNDSNGDENNDDDNNGEDMMMTCVANNFDVNYNVIEEIYLNCLSPSTSSAPSVSFTPSSNPISAPSIYCHDGFPIPIQIDIMTDSFPDETSWEIIKFTTIIQY